MAIEIRKVLRDEIKDILFQRAKSIVEERIIPETLDEIANWSGELMGKLVTLDAGEKPEIESEVLDRLYTGLLEETIEQLQKTRTPKGKTLPKK
jgi:hypothetical protein